MSIPINRAAERIQESESKLAQAASQRARVDLLVELGWELRMSQPEKAKALSENAYELSQTGDFSPSPYERGQGQSLVILAFVDAYAGRLDKAFSACLQALELLKQEPDRLAINAWYTMSWINFFLGDYPSAMENAIKALKFSREAGDKLTEAWALDVIASLHGISGDFELALEAHRESVEIFNRLNETQGQVRALNNLAYTLHMMENDAEALEYARQGLELARHSRLSNETFNIYCTLAQVLIDEGELQQAEGYLQAALSEWTVFGDTNVSQVYVLMECGRFSLLKNDFQATEAYLKKALALAETVNQPNEQALCHQKLSELYEKQGNHFAALAEYKTFHALIESVTGERANQRLATFQATYQVEAARHAAEIYRLKSLQLQGEIENQKRIQDALEQLSRLDGLTGIANRRFFDKTLDQEYARLARSNAELSLIMLDVDHFKAFNDTYGHLGGDDCLKQIAGAIKNTVARPADLVARYGGEEFACILPETNPGGARRVAEKIQQAIQELALPHRRSSTSEFVTVSIGVASSHCLPGGKVAEILLKADQQLYRAKAGGRNQIQAVTF